MRATHHPAERHALSVVRRRVAGNQPGRRSARIVARRLPSDQPINKENGVNSTIISSKTPSTNEASSAKTINNNFNPHIESGYLRNGASFTKAIDVKANTSFNGTMNITTSDLYFRYYTQFPYQFVNISLSANSTINSNEQ